MARSPSKKFRKVYWDSCAWIAVIQNETAVPLGNGAMENRAALGRAVLEDAVKGAAEIVTSTLSLTEVSKPSASTDGFAPTPQKLADFFENDYIVPVMLDRAAAELARRLMQAGHPGLRPADAIHLASAMTANVDEMHTFDGKLLDLSEKLDKRDGTKLKICKPALGGPPLPLLDSPPEVLDVSASGEGESALAEDPQRGHDIRVEIAEPEVHGDRAGTGVQRGRGAVSANTGDGGEGPATADGAGAAGVSSQTEVAKAAIVNEQEMAATTVAAAAPLIDPPTLNSLKQKRRPG